MPLAHNPSETPATAWLRDHAADFSIHTYSYVEDGGAAWAAEALGLPLHTVVKTLVMQNEVSQPLLVLMHGDCQVSTKNLARAIGAKTVQPCAPDVAQRHSGYGWEAHRHSRCANPSRSMWRQRCLSWSAFSSMAVGAD